MSDRGWGKRSRLRLLWTSLEEDFLYTSHVLLYPILLCRAPSITRQSADGARPIVRPGNQRGRPLPEPFAFPQTPPGSATLESRTNELATPSNEWEQSLYGSRNSTRNSTRNEFAPKLSGDVKTLHFASPPPPSAHIRSRSFSTTDEHTATSHTTTTEPGTFKVVIERPPFGRPRTADTGSLPILEVPIPHYRLGEPRFSAQGTAILRSSFYNSVAGSEDFRPPRLTEQRVVYPFLSSRPRSDVYSPHSLMFRSTMDRLPRQPTSDPPSARVSQLPISPDVYDALTTNPDDSAVVRFSPSGDITAATPSRLVAHVTSPSFLDYELLSDFFLTFRSFLSTRDLIAYLIARLKWAVNRQDDFGRIVRVRTFVALRHWILNYFVDDFVPVYHLRVYFCELVNSLYQELRAREDAGAGDIKIVGELKKCWRRTCALYWESEHVFVHDAIDETLHPGGNAQSPPSVDEPFTVPLQPCTPPRKNVRAQVESVASVPSDHFAGKHMDWAQRARHTPQNSLSMPYMVSQEHSRAQEPLSPASEQSVQVLSCSIPMRSVNRPDASSDMPLYPHPVPHPIPSIPSRFASSPQHAEMKKPNRPTHGHKRSGSFSDALRDNRAPLSLSKTKPTNIAFSTISKIPGSLVRGGLFQPGSPSVDLKHGGLRHMRSYIELASHEPSASEVHVRGGYATNPGVKKLIGSVRRALSSKHPSFSAPQLHSTSPTRSSNTALSSASGGMHKRRYPRGRPQVRIDALASLISERFKEAVMEQLNYDQRQNAGPTMPSIDGSQFEFDKHKSVSKEQPKPIIKGEDLRLHSGITSGSKSILIVDDTGVPPLPSGTFPGPYKEEVPMRTTSSLSIQRNVSIDATLHDSTVVSIRHSELDSDTKHVSFMNRRQTSPTSLQHSFTTPKRSVSTGREHMHSFRRRGSTKTSMSRPASLRRHSSYNSGLSRRHAVPSVATFQTTSSDNDPFFLDQPAPDATAGPARQLRRRPGGDLRAVDNVHDLEQLPRPHSTGTISNCTHSIANSVILRSDRYIDSGKEAELPKDNVASETREKEKHVSLVDTHSSQPNMRPSFEVEVAKLAALPDDIEDDGGIESALMKLEGRYEKRSPDLSKSREQSPHVSTGPEFYRPVGASTKSPNSSYVTSLAGSSHDDNVLHRPLAPPEAERQDMYRLSGEAFNGRVPAVNSTVESEDSYSSIPLFDGGLSVSTQKSMRSSAKPTPLKPTPSKSQRMQAQSTSSSMEYVIETDSMKRIPRNGTFPRSPVTSESSIRGDDDDLSDLGSYRGARSEDTSQGVRSFDEDEDEDEPMPNEGEKEFVPMHPMRHPPSPPLTANRPKDPLPQIDTTMLDRGLSTPNQTPTSRLTNQPFGYTNQTRESELELQDLNSKTVISTAGHFPFILAYDSEILAQQFTIVEKDALDEIDWRELIELRWKQSSPQIRDWVQYLRTQEARGVDVVIARFNLVVKWAVSQCILTESIEERARCIIKFIHIAAHARRLRNYATMYQITVALLSNDVSRLRKTWLLVPTPEMNTMHELEALVQPLRNFHNLRLEMEAATVEEGCIPFIGKSRRECTVTRPATNIVAQAYTLAT
jgi:hypothetical protein